MSSGDTFANLVTRLEAGDDDASREVFERYTRQLVALARQRLDARLGAKVDAEDVVQSAYRSFFIRQREGKLEIGSWQSLWGLLVLITLRKCADRAEHYRAACRDVRRETPVQEEFADWELTLERDPGPVEASVLGETVEQLFATLDEEDRPILELSLQGHSAAEISVKLGRAERTVRRLREQVRKRLERLRQEG